MTATDVSKLHVLPPNQTVRAKYNQESVLSLFLPDDMNKTGDTGKLQKEDYENMLDLTLLQDGAPAHKATATQNLIGTETIFLSSKSKSRKSVWNFQAKVEMSKPYSKNLEYPQATVEACREMISPETLENLIQSIS